jgi:hypothetical protein
MTSWVVAVAPQQQVDEFIVHEAYAQSMTEAWRYLLDNGKKLAAEFNVKPDELILGQPFGHFTCPLWC